MAQPKSQETPEPHDAAPGPVDAQQLTADVCCVFQVFYDFLIAIHTGQRQRFCNWRRKI
jgi:hypothetical protein